MYICIYIYIFGLGEADSLATACPQRHLIRKKKKWAKLRVSHDLEKYQRQRGCGIPLSFFTAVRGDVARLCRDRVYPGVPDASHSL